MAQVLMLLLVVLATLAGCSKVVPKLDEVLPDNRVEYRKSKTMPDLEIPPELTTDAIRDRMAIPEGGETATYYTYQERVAERKRQQELERTASEAVRVLDNEHVLAVSGAIPQVWPQLVDLMQSQLGYQLDLNDEELGIIETVWIENEEALRREKFKIFVEPGEEAGTSVLYISNRAEELSQQGTGMVWTPATRDVEREKLLVQRVQEKLGAADSAAETPVAQAYPLEASSGASVEEETGDEYTADSDEGSTGRAELISAGGGKVYLSVQEAYTTAWASTGAAIGNAGYDVDQSDKDRGIYYIRVPAREGETAKRGMLNKLKFWGNEEEHELQINLTGVGEKTEVVVLDKEGRWETGNVSKRILERLSRELNRPRN
ncbi:MAG: outer membrane protein assembly factor BamC [Pseudomonadota bacterium]